MKIIFTLLTFASLNAVAQNRSGIVCYEMKITLTFDTTKKPFQTKAEQMMLKIANGQVMSMFYKVIYSGTRSKKYQTETIDTSVDDTYAENTDIFIRNTIAHKDSTYHFEDNGNKTFTGIIQTDPMKFIYTGRTKKILYFNCKEIFFQVMQENNKLADILAWVTTDLPVAAGFQSYSTIKGALIEMSYSGRTLTIAGYKPLKVSVKPSLLQP